LVGAMNRDFLSAVSLALPGWAAGRDIASKGERWPDLLLARAVEAALMAGTLHMAVVDSPARAQQRQGMALAYWLDCCLRAGMADQPPACLPAGWTCLLAQSVFAGLVLHQGCMPYACLLVLSDCHVLACRAHLYCSGNSHARMRGWHLCDI